MACRFLVFSLVSLLLASSAWASSPRSYRCTATLKLDGVTRAICGSFQFVVPVYSENDEEALSVTDLSRCSGAALSLYETFDRQMVIVLSFQDARGSGSYSELRVGSSELPRSFTLETGGARNEYHQEMAIRLQCSS